MSLARAATAVFDADELELFLTLTASDDDDQEATAIVRFVSSARGFDGAGLFKSIAASMLPAGMSLFAASDAALTIWHVFGGAERYELLGANAERFTVGADGAVSVKADFSLDADARYTLTLVLRGGDVEARRDLTLELLSPFLGAAEESPVTVAADAAAGAAVFTLSLARQAGVSFDRVEANGLRTEGGNEAEIILSSSAVGLFTLDGLELSLTLTARDNLRAEMATIRFVSAPRAIESRLPIEVRLPRREALAGVTILSAGESGLDILHNGAAREVYTLSQSGDDLFGADPSLGAVTVTRNLDAGKYRLTLLLNHEGVTARRELRVVVLSLEEEALAAFVADIAADRIDWLGGDIDWDRDGVLNPYDWTPTSVTVGGVVVSVNLTLDGASGGGGESVADLQCLAVAGD